MAAKKRAAKRSKPKGIEHTLEGTPFEPGAKVAVHNEPDVSYERSMSREPIADALSTATVKQDTSVTIRVPRKGQYTLSAQDGDRYRYLTVGVTHN